MADLFTEKVRTALARTLRGGKRVCAALSGGADSTALLRVLKELGGELSLELSACHLNHGLRGDESDRDEEFCRRLCDNLNIPLYTRKIDVRVLAEKHESSEETARRVRYSFFEDALGFFGAELLATAHTQSDNSETVLLNLLRGTGLRGLCGIPRERGLGEFRIIRPLLDCSKDEICGYLASLGQGYVTDSSNLREDYTRNKIRLRVLPELRGINPSADAVIARMSGLLREDEELLDSLVQKALDEAREGRGWNALSLSALPEALKKRAVKSILSNGGIEPSALRIDTAAKLLVKRSARYNPCKDHFFTIRKGICFVENIKQNYRNR